MQEPRIEKLTLNIGAGKDQGRLDKGMQLIKSLTGIEPIKTITQKRIAGWGLRPGLPIGCKLTLRKEKASDMLRRILKAKDNKLKITQFDENGSVSFGVPEYIDIEGAKYNPKIGMMGLEVSVTIEKPGYKIKRRKIKQKKIGKKHRVTKTEAINFLKSKFDLTIQGEEEWL